MQPPVLVTWLLTLGDEIATRFHGMSEGRYRERGHTSGNKRGGDGIPVFVILVHALLRRYNLVDGTNLGTRCGTSPRMLELLSDYL